MQDTPRHPITVSIVSHGQQALVVPLLLQLQQFSSACIDRIILTSNIPEFDQVSSKTWRLPIEIVVNEHPKGFGANHNAAFTRCKTDWFLVLNPDIRIDSDILGALLMHAQLNSGLMAPRIVEPGKSAPEPYRALITPMEVLRRNRQDYSPPPLPAWIPGMFMLFRDPAYRKISGFNEQYFMYGEDFDICARLQLAGWQIHIAEELHALHAAQRASRRDWQHFRWHLMSLGRLWSSSTFWRYRAMLARKMLRGPSAAIPRRD